MDTPPPEDVPPEPMILPAADLPPLGEPTEEELPVVLPPWTPPTRTLETRTILFLCVLGFGAVIYVLLLVVGGWGERFASAGVQVLPFLGLALLAYAGERSATFRVLTIIYWVLLIGAAVATSVVLTGLTVIDVSALGRLMEAARAGKRPPFAPSALLVPHGAAHFVWTAIGCLGTAFVGASAFRRGVRQTAARILPAFNPESFVHAVALATVVALTFTMFAPLVGTGEPPFLAIIRNFTGAELGEKGKEIAAQLSDQNMLVDQAFSFVWLVPVGIMVVGWPLHRTLPAALRRVGFVISQPWQISFALGMAGAMAVFMAGIGDPAIGRFWDIMNWPRTDEKAFELLFKSMTSPIGAVIVAVTAGVGEELCFRGILQPRLGIFLSNLFFTSVHALQYNWDAASECFSGWTGAWFGAKEDEHDHVRDRAWHL